MCVFAKPRRRSCGWWWVYISMGFDLKSLRPQIRFCPLSTRFFASYPHPLLFVELDWENVTWRWLFIRKWHTAARSIHFPQHYNFESPAPSPTPCSIDGCVCVHTSLKKKKSNCSSLLVERGTFIYIRELCGVANACAIKESAFGARRGNARECWPLDARVLIWKMTLLATVCNVLYTIVVATINELLRCIFFWEGGGRILTTFYDLKNTLLMPIQVARLDADSYHLLYTYNI